MINAPLPFLVGAHQSEFLQILHGGVDRAGTGDILAGRAFLERLNNLVAVFRSVAQCIQQHIARLTALSPSAPATVTASPMMTFARMFPLVSGSIATSRTASGPCFKTASGPAAMTAPS